jgi:hypothetical protein
MERAFPNGLSRPIIPGRDAVDSVAMADERLEEAPSI